MKIAYCSDLHLEFNSIELKNEMNADVLILAGDICVVKHFDSKIEKFFDNISSEFEQIFYVLGNHEYYHGNMDEEFNKLVELADPYDNITIINNRFVRIDNVKFLFSSLWTNLNDNDPITYTVIRNTMNDVKLIEGLTEEKWITMFNNSFSFLSDELDVDEDCVVVTHHAPSFRSVYDDDKHDYKTNGGYCSNLEEFIIDREPLIWIHGHTHHKVDYIIGNTRIVSNPRGYSGFESMADNFKLEYIDI